MSGAKQTEQTGTGLMVGCVSNSRGSTPGSVVRIERTASCQRDKVALPEAGGGQSARVVFEALRKFRKIAFHRLRKTLRR